MTVRVEICVTGVESAIAAQEGGADRVELCEDLAVGGVTPSAGAIALTCKNLTIPTQVLIRPRRGDFRYSPIEFAVMKHDLRTAKEMGASGVVLGLLNPDRTIDRERLAVLLELAHPLTVTFHKAFDETRDPREALELLIELGVDRILTSGRQALALDGLPLIAELVEQAGDRIVVMAGGGVAESHVRPILGSCALREIHLGSAATSPVENDPPRTATEAARVARIVQAVRAVDR